MAFEKKVPEWNAAGSEPPASLKNSGFTAGYKPPAAYFNWFWYQVSQCLTELQEQGMSMKAINIEAGGNMDDCTAIGIYTYSMANSASIANVPEQAQATVLVLPRIMNNSPENVVQVAFTYTNCIYVRNRSDSTWNGWRKFFKDNDIIPLAHGGTGGKTAEEARANLGVAAADHGRHVPKTCVTVEDWNNATETGWYMANNAANGPTTVEAGGTMWYFGYVIAHNSNYVLQEVYQFTASATATAVPKYIRIAKEGTWGGWHEVTVQQKVPFTAKLDYIKTLTSDAQAQLDAKWAKAATVLNAGASLDDCTTSGIYTYSLANAPSIKNAPEETQTTLLVYPRLMASDQSNLIQVAITSSNTVYVRNDLGGTWNEWRKLFKDDDLIPVANGGTGSRTAAGALATLGAMASKPKFIELTPETSDDNGGYIDFHYAGATDDFTSRIIEEAKGCLRFSAPNGAKVSTIAPEKDAIRNIQAGTTDMTAGTSTLATGAVYLVFE